MACTFAGQRLAPLYLKHKITIALDDLVSRYDHIIFLSGGMGDFDTLCEQAVRETKGQRPDIKYM